MKRQLITVLVLTAFLIPFPIWGWGVVGMSGSHIINKNDFSGDSNCIALWRFESGALTTDSKGGNTLTDYNTVGTNTVDYKEGSASADLELSNSEYFGIADADLDAGFPLKSGDSNKKISVTSWFRIETLPGIYNEFLYSKYAIGKISFAISIDKATDCLRLTIGYDGGTSVDHYVHASTLSTNKWYHYGVTWQDSDKSYRIRIWDDNASAILGVDKTGIGSNNINVEDAEVCIGAREGASGEYDGEIDETVVFKDILSQAEIDKIRVGTYP